MEITLKNFYNKLSYDCDEELYEKMMSIKKTELERLLEKENNEYVIITIFKKYNQKWINYINKEYFGIGTELWIEGQKDIIEIIENVKNETIKVISLIKAESSNSEFDNKKIILEYFLCELSNEFLPALKSLSL